MSELLLDRAGRRRSPATMPGFHAGRPPHNKGLRYPADPPKVEEIVGVMQGVIVLCVVIAYELVRRYSLKSQQRMVGAELAAAGQGGPGGPGPDSGTGGEGPGDGGDGPDDRGPDAGPNTPDSPEKKEVPA